MSKLIKCTLGDGTPTESYKSIAEAARAYNCDESTIRKALNSNRLSQGKYWYSEEENSTNAKILILDIETSPLRAFVWRLWDQNISLDGIISDWFMLSWAAKWLGEEEAYSAVLTPVEVMEENDLRIVRRLRTLIDEADIVVAHHGDKFDMPKIRSRFLVHGMTPPSPYKQIDTKKIASREFGFSSNKLEALARLLGFQGKDKTEFQLWVDCMKGDGKALKRMEEYNVQDIYVLENVYVALRPYIKGHPNLDLYIDSDTSHCPSCGKDALVPIYNKFFYTQSVRYQTYRCTSCNSLSRAKKGTPYNSKKQVSAIPR
jgi:DNA polymerase elongation subunit (family B)